MAAARPVLSSLYQMLQPAHQRPVYQLHITRCGLLLCSCNVPITGLNPRVVLQGSIISYWCKNWERNGRLGRCDLSSITLGVSSLPAECHATEALVQYTAV